VYLRSTKCSFYAFRDTQPFMLNAAETNRHVLQAVGRAHELFCCRNVGLAPVVSQIGAMDAQRPAIGGHHLREHGGVLCRAAVLVPVSE
jgi:hypothetical protein